MPFSFLFIITILKVKKNIFFFVLQWIMPTYVKAMLLVYNSIVLELQKQWSYNLIALYLLYDKNEIEKCFCKENMMKRKWIDSK